MPRFLSSLLIISIKIIISISGQNALLDSRCFLDGGGSAENFLISEDLPVGSLIGKLRIIGDPDPIFGNIKLSLRESNAPISIVAGQKDISLATSLDKEGISGPSLVYVNIICDRTHSNDPSFVIPLNVRVSDVNDNSPQWIGAPYNVSLSEVTLVGSRIPIQIKAIDLDQPGQYSTVEYEIIDGPNSDFVSFKSLLDSDLVLKKQLDYETINLLIIKLRAKDQGTPARFMDAVLRINVIDADDQNPKFNYDSYYGRLPSHDRIGRIEITPESLHAYDQDKMLNASIGYSITPSAESPLFSIDTITGDVRLIQPAGLAMNKTITLLVKATQIDNDDRYALVRLTVMNGMDNNQIDKSIFSRSSFRMDVRENERIGRILLPLVTGRPRTFSKFFIPDSHHAKYFAINSLGEVILTSHLDYERDVKHEFTVIGKDGNQTAETRVIINVLDVNDWEPRFRQSLYEFRIPDRGVSLPVYVGKIEVADGDRYDQITLELNGTFAQYMYINALGALYMQRDLWTINRSEITLTINAFDSGDPRRSTSVPLRLKIGSTQNSSVLNHTGFLNSNLLKIFGIGIGILIIISTLHYCYTVNKRSKHAADDAHPTSGFTNTKLLVDSSHIDLRLPTKNMRFANLIYPTRSESDLNHVQNANTSTSVQPTEEKTATRRKYFQMDEISKVNGSDFEDVDNNSEHMFSGNDNKLVVYF